MSVLTHRDVRALRAQIRRFAHEAGCGEVEALVEHCGRLGSIDVTGLSPTIAAWITEAYVVLTHEIVSLQREYQEASTDTCGAPTLTRTVAGAKLSHILDVFQDVDDRPADYGLPPGGTWSSRVTRLDDAWVGSLHAERYRLDFWGPASLVENVFSIVARRLFP